MLLVVENSGVSAFAESLVGSDRIHKSSRVLLSLRILFSSRSTMVMLVVPAGEKVITTFDCGLSHTNSDCGL